MRESSTAPLVQLGASDALSDLIEENAAERPFAAAFQRPGPDGWDEVTNDQFRREARELAKGFAAAGVQVGDRVGLLSRTRYEWTLLDFALWYAGAVVVPVYETSAPAQVSWILADSGARWLVVESPEHAATVSGLAAELTELRTVWCIDDGDLTELAAAGADVADTELSERRHRIGADSLATIIYTSGTTGRPKGCRLTHGNFVSNARNIVTGMSDVFCVPGASTVLFLPLAHVFARIIEVACVNAGVRIAHTPNTDNLLDDLATVRPTFLLAVPRVFERVYNGAARKAEESGKGRIFERASDTAIAWSQAHDDGHPGLGLRLRHRLFDVLVYGKLRAALGGHVQYAVSGGAPLGARLGHFFRGIGVTVLEGYGLTETTAGACVNRPGALRIGTVGRPVPGASVRVDDDGEVQFSGGLVFDGYWGDEQASLQTFTEDGWLRTGDLGSLDDDGFLTITGRIKEILVTAGGKNVAPSGIEDVIRRHPLVSQCVVVGDRRPYIAALLALDPEALPHWLSSRGRTAGTEVADLIEDPELLADLAAAVEEANDALSRAETVKRFVILPVDLTEANGLLTPSLKVRRDVVAERFATQIEELYATPKVTPTG